MRAIFEIEVCGETLKGMYHVLQKAALDSVLRSINNPTTSNVVKVSGLLNILVAIRNEGIMRFVHAVNSLTYSDNKAFLRSRNGLVCFFFLKPKPNI